MTTTLTPGEVSTQTQLSLDTLRYYEREGLIGPIGRNPIGRREYTDDDVFWIGLVTCLRAAGLGIADLREFTVMLRTDNAVGERVDFLTRHRARLEKRAQQLRTAIEVLDEKIAYYRNTEN